MDEKLFLRNNNGKVNLLVAKCLRYTLYLLLIIWVFTCTVMRDMDLTAITLCIASCGIILLIPTLFINVFNVKKRYVNYIVVTCTSIVTFILSSFLSNLASPMLLFPLLLASIYYDRVLILYSTLLNTISILGSSMLAVKLSFFKNDPLVANFETALIGSALPKILIMIFMSIIAYFIVLRNSSMLQEMFMYSNQLKTSQEEVIMSFADICESKSRATGEHVRRVSKYMRILAEASGFASDYTDKVCTASMLHDIGKLMIPEEILNKPERLNKDEYAIMRNHVLYGEALLHNANGDIMNMARTLALQHHERWDGKGYLGMKGEEVAYISRLMALADVFDALSAARCYKEEWSLEDTYTEIVNSSGTQFDPQVVDLFVKNYDKFVEVFNQIPDTQKREDEVISVD